MDTQGRVQGLKNLKWTQQNPHQGTPSEEERSIKSHLIASPLDQLQPPKQNSAGQCVWNGVLMSCKKITAKHDY